MKGAFLSANEKDKKKLVFDMKRSWQLKPMKPP
jgi:hypothetical protein